MDNFLNCIALNLVLQCSTIVHHWITFSSTFLYFEVSLSSQLHWKTFICPHCSALRLLLVSCRCWLCWPSICIKNWAADNLFQYLHFVFPPSIFCYQISFSLNTHFSILNTSMIMEKFPPKYPIVPNTVCKVDITFPSQRLLTSFLGGWWLEIIPETPF